MPNLSSSRAAEKCHLPNAERGKVVVKEEAFLGFAFEGFQTLFVVAGAESGGHQGLRFTAGEDGRAMSTRQHTDFNPDVANLVEGAPVGTPLLIDDRLAEDALAQGLVISLQFGLGGFVFFRDGR